MMLPTPKNAPQKFASFPGVAPCIRAWNSLVDYLAATRALPGSYLTASQTPDGVVFDLSPELKALLDRWMSDQNILANGQTPATQLPGGTIIRNTNTTNGGGGNGLPGTEVDGDGNLTYDGKPLDWRMLHVCVDDGAGGYTPMVVDIFSTAPYIPA